MAWTTVTGPGALKHLTCRAPPPGLLLEEEVSAALIPGFLPAAEVGAAGRS